MSTMRTLRRHWERDCRALTLEEVGAQLALAALAEAREDGRGVITANGAALGLALAVTPQEALGLVEGLRRKGRLRRAETSPGTYEITMTLFCEHWERERDRRRRGVRSSKVGEFESSKVLELDAVQESKGGRSSKVLKF